MPHIDGLPRSNAGLDTLLALESVPPITTTRWVPRRKAQVVRAVQADLLSREEALRLYRLTDEEFDAWRSALALSGESGLRVTRRTRGWTGADLLSAFGS